jgi:hypothetical protein
MFAFLSAILRTDSRRPARDPIFVFDAGDVLVAKALARRRIVGFHVADDQVDGLHVERRGQEGVLQRTACEGVPDVQPEAEHVAALELFLEMDGTGDVFVPVRRFDGRAVDQPAGHREVAFRPVHAGAEIGHAEFLLVVDHVFAVEILRHVAVFGIEQIPAAVFPGPAVLLVAEEPADDQVVPLHDVVGHVQVENIALRHVDVGERIVGPVRGIRIQPVVVVHLAVAFRQGVPEAEVDGQRVPDVAFDGPDGELDAAHDDVLQVPVQPAQLPPAAVDGFVVVDVLLRFAVQQSE